MKMPACRLFCHLCRIVSSNFAGGIFAALGYGVIVFAFAFSLFFTPGTARAQMSQLSDGELRGITGQSGLSISLNGAAKIYLGSYKFSDTETSPNWIELYNVTVDDGAGGGFSFSTPGSDFTGTTALDPNTTDVGTNSSGQTIVSIRDTSHMNPRWYKVGDFGLNCYSPVDSLYHYQSLGSLSLDALQMGPSVSHYGSQTVNNGIIFDYQTAISASALTYTYNTGYTDNTSGTPVIIPPASLNLSGLHIAGLATGDPTDPTAWAYSGTFNIGDISTMPAAMDVGTDTSNNKTSLYLSLPMSGSVRVAEVNFGGQNFGPIAIDGIQVHRLNLKFTP